MKIMLLFLGILLISACSFHSEDKNYVISYDCTGYDNKEEILSRITNCNDSLKNCKDIVLNIYCKQKIEFENCNCEKN